MDFLVLSPDKELSFKKPFTATSKQHISVKNNLSEPIAFKIKTTAPKQYCVRPNSGRLGAGESCTVSVLLQAMKEDPPSDFICKDKFLIQSIKIEKEVLGLDQDDANTKLLNLWSTAENSKKAGVSDALFEKKIKVVFVDDVQPSVQAPLLDNPVSTSNFAIPNDRPTSFMSINDDSLRSIINQKEKELVDAQMKIKSLTSRLEQAQLENDRLNQGLKQRKLQTESPKDLNRDHKHQMDLRIFPAQLLESTFLVPIEWMSLLFVILALLVVLLL